MPTCPRNPAAGDVGVETVEIASIIVKRSRALSSSMFCDYQRQIGPISLFGGVARRELRGLLRGMLQR
jgi:hypothetical protein